MSAELPDPISEVLEDTADEARVRKIWQGISDQQKKRGPNVGLRVAAASVLAAAAALLIYLAWPSEQSAPIAHGPITRSSGAPFAAIEGDETIELSDGSRIVLEDARLEPLENDGRSVTLLLARGSARFEVEPGGPRTWTIESGVASVEVVGTVFTVERGEGWARVAVEHGTVVVRGERVPERAARLTVGQSLMVGEERTAEIAPPPEQPAEVIAEEPAPRRPAPDAEALMARADQARRAGDLRGASLLYERAAALGDDPSAGVAAFTLGRLELDSLHRPDRAARAFARALDLTLPPRLREDAAARLVQAHRESGDAASADRAARAYLAQYPDGRHTERVREALADP
jgi:transmembrane sensor